jgi:hypothetical protein
VCFNSLKQGCPAKTRAAAAARSCRAAPDARPGRHRLHGWRHASGYRRTPRAGTPAGGVTPAPRPASPPACLPVCLPVCLPARLPAAPAADRRPQRHHRHAGAANRPPNLATKPPHVQHVITTPHLSPIRADSPARPIQPTCESLRMSKWKAILPFLTISTGQFDTHMISQLTTEYIRDAEFAKHFQTPKAPYILRGLISWVFVAESRTVPYAASCCMITTTR